MKTFLQYLNESLEPWQMTRAEYEGEPWDNARTGKPITLFGWRGAGTKYGGLTPEYQARFHREFLLGDGVYMAPTKTLASHFGEPKSVKMTFHNPLVINSTNTTQLLKLDLNAIIKAHDGIVIQSGQSGFGSGQESLKQAVMFPGHEDQVERDVKPPEPSTIAVGAKVKIISVLGPKDYVDNFRQKHQAVLGKTGTVTSIKFGMHPTVKIGGKTLLFNAPEVQVIGGSHRSLVQQALQDGKPVPREVLADYPDLKT